MQFRCWILIYTLLLLANSADGQKLPRYISSSEIRREFASCFEDFQASSCTYAIAYYTFVGLVDSAVALNDKVYSYQFKYNSGSGLDSFNCELTTAKEDILKHIGNSKVVMFNEQHHYPPNRIFTASLLSDLKKLGFNYFGCEGITSADILNSNGYPTVNIGFLPQEPQFANMIRIALNLGYTVFGYKHIYGGVEARERGQAENIAKIIKQDSSAKIVIHAGLGHICEDTSFKYMGFYFKQFTKIDPYSINQSTMLEHSKTEYELPLYRKIADTLKHPMVLINGSNITSSGFSCYDTEVCLPRTDYINGRANWLYSSYLIKHQIELPAKTSFPALIKVYLKSESENKNYAIAVPVDAIELFNEQKTVNIFVPFKGDYVVQFDQHEPYSITIN